jgi:hypothetical protein
LFDARTERCRCLLVLEEALLDRQISGSFRVDRPVIKPTRTREITRPEPARSPAMIRSSIEPFSTPEQMVNAISAFTEVATEADLRPMAQERFALTLSGLEALLGQAIARGELAGI